MNADSSAPASHHGQRSSWFFKLLIGASALFIAGCSAYFSVRGLGLLFIGSATAVMVMAASLEIGKLVAASFLYRYWSQITIPLRLYLTLAVIVLIAITSLGNYGYLARAYEITHTQITSIEQQIIPLQQDIDATQIQIDASRSQIGKFTDTGREDRDKIQSQITEANQALDQALVRLEDRRKAAKDRQDHDSQTFSSRLPEAAELLKKDLASEDEAIAKLNERVAVLDRAVDAYTALGGPGFLKRDGIKKGQILRQEQEPERKVIADEIITHQRKQDQLRADYAKATEAINRDLTAVQALYHKDLAALDAEEQSLRKNRADTVAKIEKQVSTLQSQTQTVSRQGQDQIAGLYQRIAADNQEIARLRQQIAGFDIGPYRFIARTFNANSDDVVKWLVLLLVAVFDPLAVILTVGLNIALVNDRRASVFVHNGPSTATPSPRSRASRITLWIILLLVAAGLAVAAKVYAPSLFKHWKNSAEQRATVGLIPSDSFLVLSLRPDRMQDPTGNFVWNKTVASLLGKSALSRLADLFGDSLDADSDVYVFVKYPARQNTAQTQSPVMLCGLVARLKDPVAAETGLNRFADSFADSLRQNAPAAPSRHPEMVRYGNGRYLDPQGNFLSYALTDQHVVLLLEIDGDPAKPTVEEEIRQILSPAPSSEVTLRAARLPNRALSADAAVSLWFDASRCFADMPKNSAAQNRYQQLAGRLNFDLLVTLNPTKEGRLNLTADYNYTGERFGSKPLPSLQDTFGKLGPVDPAGAPGRLMDRCAVTLDMDAFMDRLPAMLTPSGGDTAQIHVEKSIDSSRSGHFELVAQYDPKAGLPFQAALRNLAR
ncbi:MAG: hypothetical protein WC661_11215 [Opitutaceae bacterium]|jgi:hypothetical protein